MQQKVKSPQQPKISLNLEEDNTKDAAALTRRLSIQKKKTIRMPNKPESGMNNIKSTALSPEKEKSGAFKMSS